ncbi:hypothetical protein BV22DRAFT_1135559, partial [Leucogyrophana mollusca]
SQGRAGDGDGDSEILTPEESIVAGFFNVVTEALPYAIGTLLGRSTGAVIPRTKRIAPGLPTVKVLGKRKQKKLERSEEKETVEKENEGENGEGESDDEGPFEAALTHRWSEYYLTHAVTGTPLAVKPDLVLSDRGQNSHADIHMICELSRREWRLDLEHTLYGKSYTMFKVQKDRRFVYAISVCDYLVRISMYDRSGAVHTRGYNIHKEPLTLIRVLIAFLYLPPQYLGYDPTVKLVSFPRELHLFLPICGVLHCDISIDNIMLYKELDENGNLRRRGLLVDYDYAIPMNVPGRAISPGNRMGTIPFMAIGILVQYALSEFVELHTIAHDIESIVLVLIYICVAYNGPCNRLCTDKPFEETPLIG